MTSEQKAMYKLIIDDFKQLGGSTTDDLHSVIANLPENMVVTGSDFEILRNKLKIKD